MAYNTSNPVLSNKFWSNIEGHESMSYEGTMQKIGIMFGTTVLFAALTAYAAIAINMNLAMAAMIIGGITGFILVLILVFSRPKNPVPLMLSYAVFEGLFVGGVSLIFEQMYSGIVFQAAVGTMCIVGAMYGLYATRIIKATPMFQKVVMSLVMGIMLLYVVSFILSFIPGSFQVPFLHSSGPIGILLTLFILGVASLCLILDFNFIETGIQQQTPKVGEWWGAFGLLVTVIWIYIEMLRLLSKVRSNLD
ncbi:MAG: Bax inhibitor-1/YccA family protein [Candidatus Poseidoniales archaeon]|jgi:uncharacterized YccA/Bax inhibitor family protein|tara:strand:- start:873 stop:1622 length:750 start_codon:yes stop_codon:yes gene_type:complete